jgi:hypothetical protein
MPRPNDDDRMACSSGLGLRPSADSDTTLWDLRMMTREADGTNSELQYGHNL